MRNKRWQWLSLREIQVIVSRGSLPIFGSVSLYVHIKMQMNVQHLDPQTFSLFSPKWGWTFHTICQPEPSALYSQDELWRGEKIKDHIPGCPSLYTEKKKTIRVTILCLYFDPSVFIWPMRSRCGRHAQMGPTISRWECNSRCHVSQSISILLLFFFITRVTILKIFFYSSLVSRVVSKFLSLFNFFILIFNYMIFSRERKKNESLKHF